MDTQQLRSAITPIVTETYGTSVMSLAMVDDLVQKIQDFTPRYEEETREREIMLTVWNWFSGGDTAASVARKIEAVL